MKINCDNCGKEFDKIPSQMKRSKSGKHYCSRSCSQTVNNRGVARNKPRELECRKCGKTFTRNANWRSEVFCSVECREASMLTRDDATLEELHEAYLKIECLMVPGKKYSYRELQKLFKQ